MNIPAARRALLRIAAKKLIERIAADVPLRQVERAIGLSQGYLSKIRHGRGAPPSAMLVALLRLVARDPARALNDLTAFWAETYP